MTSCEGPHPGEESCGCSPIGTFGVIPADDPRYLGGFVDARGIRHDPLKHANDCPRVSTLKQTLDT